MTSSVRVGVVLISSRYWIIFLRWSRYMTPALSRMPMIFFLRSQLRSFFASVSAAVMIVGIYCLFDSFERSINVVARGGAY